MTAARATLDRRAVRRGFDRAAPHYDQHAVLAREVARRALERLEVIRMAPRRIADVGAGTGAGGRDLAQRYPKAELLSLDLSLAMLQHARPWLPGWRRWLPGAAATARRVCADMSALPLAAGCVDLLWSNLALAFVDDPLAAMAEFRRVLAPGGLAMLTSFGPDTLRELRAAWARVDDRPHVHEFLDMHDLGDLLLQAGLSDPVTEMEDLTLTYSSFDDLLRDLRGGGARNAASARRRSLTGKGARDMMLSAYEGQRASGRLPATFEVVYAHAWNSARPAARGAGGHAVIRFERAPRSGRS